jgi:hypothetical protein
MATSEGTVEKINVRSPFYLDVDSENAPADYTPPATITQTIECGSEINISEDAGTRIFRIDTTGRTGGFALNFTVNVPIKITTQFSEAGSATVHGFKGDSKYKEQLEELGIASSDLTGLSSGEQQFGFTVTTSKAADDTGHLDVTIDAPYTTDDYKISFSCPAKPVFTQPTPTPSSGIAAIASNTVLSGTQSLYIRFIGVNNTSSKFPRNGLRSQDGNESMSIFINGSQVKGITSSELNWSANKDVWIIFSNEDSAGDGSLSGTPYNYRNADNTTSVPIMVSSTSMNSGVPGGNARDANTIAFKWTSPNSTWSGGGTTSVDRYGRLIYNNAGPKVTSANIEIGLTNLFKNGTSSTLEWTNERLYSTYNDYGYDLSLSAATRVPTDTVEYRNSVPRLMSRSFGGHSWIANSNDYPNHGRLYGFHFNPVNMTSANFTARRQIVAPLDNTNTGITTLNQNKYTNQLVIFGIPLSFTNTKG